MFFIVGFLVGGVLGIYAKPLAKLGAKLYLATKEKKWQPKGKEKKEVEKSLNPISPDPDKSVNTLVMGSDSGSNKGEKGWCRSDVMMLVCLKEKDKKAVVVSIPRDTRVMIPGHGVEKMNAAHSFGGPAGAINIVKQFLGVDVNHFVSMDFDGFRRIIDALGGIPIHLSKPINDPHAGYLPAGDLLLDGQQALVVVRSRRLPGGDVDRIKNQQAFLKAVIKKADNMRSVWKAKQLVDIVASTCQMDYSAGDLMTLAEELRGFSIDKVQFATLPGHSQTIGGASYFLADEPRVAEIMAEVKNNTEISPELMARLQVYSQGNQSQVQELYSPTSDVITVLSSGKAGIGAVPTVAEELRLLGHQKIFEGMANQVLPKTTIYHRREAKGISEDIKKTVTEFADADVVLNDQVTSQYNSPIVVILRAGFATPNLLSLYGRVLKPAVNVNNLGRRVKSFS